MAETKVNHLFRLEEAFKLGGPATEWTTILINLLNKVGTRSGTTVPAITTAGYVAGCIFIKTDAVLGQTPLWVNRGSVTSCKFVPVGPSIGYSAAWALHRADITGNAATTHAYIDQSDESDLTISGFNITDDDNHMIKASNPAKGVVTVTANADGLAAHSHNLMGIREGCVAEYDIFAADEIACLTADDTTVARVVAGILTDDICFATVNTTDDSDTVSGISALADGTLTLTASADPGADNTHKWDYVVFRKRGFGIPSHYIAYAGVHTAAGGDTTEVITITGAKATDIAICMVETSDDADTIKKAILTADTLTLTLSADPTAGAKKYNYMILRAY